MPLTTVGFALPSQSESILGSHLFPTSCILRTLISGLIIFGCSHRWVSTCRIACHRLVKWLMWWARCDGCRCCTSDRSSPTRQSTISHPTKAFFCHHLMTCSSFMIAKCRSKGLTDAAVDGMFSTLDGEIMRPDRCEGRRLDIHGRPLWRI